MFAIHIKDSKNGSFLTLCIIKYGSRVNEEKEWNPPLPLSVAAYEKGAFESPSTMVGQLISVRTLKKMKEHFYGWAILDKHMNV